LGFLFFKAKGSAILNDIVLKNFKRDFVVFPLKRIFINHTLKREIINLKLVRIKSVENGFVPITPYQFIRRYKGVER